MPTLNAETIKLIDDWYERVRDELEPSQRAAVDALHTQSAQAAHVLARMLFDDLQVSEPALGPPPEDAPATPEALGEYTLIRPIGSGGFSTVYLAERHEPLPQRVAVKLLGRWLDGETVGRYFEHERRTQGRLNHPCIPRFLNCGIDPVHGRYLVMELVDGAPITDHCRHAGLGLAARLRVMARVCDAVAYAHEQGVVHRDIKPSNVLVTRSRGWDEPKVIDFGISSSVIAAELHAPGARAPQVLGTPSAMAPEQFSGGTVGAAADVFALGVLLYELVADRHPFLAAGERVSPRDLAARVRQAPPSPPLATDAACALPPPALAAINELALACLSVDPAGRPASAGAIAAALRRLLPGDASPEAIEGRIDAARQRQRGGEAAEAEAQMAEAHELALRTLGPEHRLTLRAAMLLAVCRDEQDRRAEVELPLRTTLEQQARVLGPDDAETLECMGHLALHLGETQRFEESEALNERVLAGRRSLLGDDHPETMITLNNLAAAKYRLGRTDAGAELFEHLAIVRERVLGPDHPDVFVALANLGAIRMKLGRLDSAEANLRRAIDGFARVLGDSHAATLSTRNNLVKLLHKSGRFDEAVSVGEATFERALAALSGTHHVTRASVQALLDAIAAGDWRDPQRAAAVQRLKQRVEACVA